ncbi:tail length tape measure protein [Vibrio phage K460]
MATAAQKAGLTVNGTVAEMSELMEQGKLISEDVLPHFATELRNAAKANGGLEKALLSNRVAMNQMVTAAQSAADTTFMAGWSEGLTIMFKSVGQMLQDNKMFFEEFGETMGKVFKGVAWVVENVFSPVLSALGSVLHTINESMESFVAIFASAGTMLLGRFYKPLKKVIKQFGGFKSVLRGIMFLAKRMFLPFYLGLGVLEEVAEFLSPTGKKTLLGVNIDTMSNPFQSWVDSLDTVWEKINRVLNIIGAGSDPEVVGTTKGITPYNNEAFNKPNQNRTPVLNVHLEGHVMMDKQAVGRQVMRSEAAKTAIGYGAQYGQGTNR